jgi:1-acyl-sn-glycerol-3-phosphate acyltransferase
MMLWLRTGVFFVSWVAFTLVSGVVCLPMLLSRRSCWAYCDAWVNTTLWLLRVCCGVRADIRGDIPTVPCIVASNHQSAMDTMLLWQALRHPIFMLKRELFYIPIYGWYVWRSRHIAVKRNARIKPLEQMIATAKSALADGRPLVIFPEGTRVPPGESRPYRNGAATMSHALQVQVVPVALNTGHFWPKKLLKKFPGVAQLKFLAPLAPCQNEPKDQWTARLKNAITSA